MSQRIVNVKSSANDFVTNAAFNTGDGVLTLTVPNQTNPTVDLDGRYLLSAAEGDAYGIFTVVSDSGFTWGSSNVVADSPSDTLQFIAGTDIQIETDPVNDAIRIRYAGSAGASNFINLGDTPGSYTGQANKMVVVNGTPDALIFIDRTTTNVPEGSNLYYTTERVEDAVAVLINDGTGLAWTYVDNGAGLGTLTGNVSLTIFSTTNLSEGTNLYFTDERAQDAIGTILADTQTIDFTYNDATPNIIASVISQMSITDDASGIKLVGDSAAPGNNYYYGTNGAGAKGWLLSSSANDNDFLTGASFNSGTGVITYTIPNQSNVTVDIDGRYIEESSIVGGDHINVDNTSPSAPVIDYDGTYLVNQTGFGTARAVDDWIALAGSTYVVANATDATAVAIGIITEIVDANNIRYADIGDFAFATAGLTTGTAYYLSTTNATMTSTEPADFVQPLCIATSASTIQINVDSMFVYSGTVSGFDINRIDQIATAKGAITGSISFDMSKSNITCNLTGNVTSIAFTNEPGASDFTRAVINVTQDAGTARSMTWTGSGVFPGQGINSAALEPNQALGSVTEYYLYWTGSHWTIDKQEIATTAL